MTPIEIQSKHSNRIEISFCMAKTTECPQEENVGQSLKKKHLLATLAWFFFVFGMGCGMTIFLLQQNGALV